MSGNSSRTQNTAKNIIWGYVGSVLTMLVQFLARTVFIYTVGVDFLGINGLFTSVLGMLSLSELGVGTAINYNLYKPVAEHDREKIKALMSLYKKAYRIIALVILIIGLCLLPFLSYVIKGADEIPNVSIYYLLFLFNTVSSYFVSYKYGLVNAEQKGYIINNLNSIFTVVITIGQVMVLLLFENYLLYLVAQTVLQLTQKIYIGIYLNRRYPYLHDKKIDKLDRLEIDKIKKNVFALMLHKLGEISVYQTDNIIISAFINVTVVGKVSNYNLVITSVTTFLNIIFNSVTSSIGNLIALETKKRQEEIFNMYSFVGFWLYGFSCICFWVLFQPFITLWIGGDKIVDFYSVTLIILNQYLVGRRLVVNNMKMSGGVFSQDKYVALLQGMVNLIVSIICVTKFGLLGVYIGTIVSGILPSLVRPIVLYKSMFNCSAKNYFVKSAIYFGVIVIAATATKLISYPLTINPSWGKFCGMLICCICVPNVIFTFCFCKTDEFKGIVVRIKNIVQSHNIIKLGGK